MRGYARRRWPDANGWRWCRSFGRSPGWVIATASVGLVALAVIVVCIQAVSQQIAPPPGFSVAETLPTAGQIALRIPPGSDDAVKFYRYVPGPGAETRFFVARTANGVVRSALDACAECFQERRGFRHQGARVVCNSCGRATPLREVGVVGGGCSPVLLEHRVEHGLVTVAAPALQSGGRYFQAVGQ